MSDQNQERTFADGFIFKRRDNAPEWVIGNISIKVDEAIAFLKSNEKKGWVNLNVKKGRSGNPYIELDTFEAKPKDAAPAKEQAPPPPAEAEEDGDLPF
jgi:hypothetical protein